MRILITGGAGFIGQYVAARLATHHDLVAFDALRPQVHTDPASAVRRFPGEVVEGDVSDPDAWSRLSRPEAIIHLAAETGTGQSMYEQDLYDRVNVEGTRLVGRAAQAWGVPLVAMSSRAVYGNGRFVLADGTSAYGEDVPTDATPAPSRETDPHHPVSHYGQTKSLGEQALVDVAREVPVSILRPQNVIGYGQALHNPYTGVLAAFLARLREGRNLAVYGDGSATRDFVHVSDVAHTLEWMLETPPTPGESRVLNSGTGERTSLTQLAEFARDASPGPAVDIEYVDVHRAGDIDHAVADLDLTARLGAPLPRVSSREAIADFIVRSWQEPGARSTAWDDALHELGSRGLTS